MSKVSDVSPSDPVIFYYCKNEYGFKSLSVMNDSDFVFARVGVTDAKIEFIMLGAFHVYNWSIRPERDESSNSSVCGCFLVDS